MNLGLSPELRNRMQNNMVDEIINTDKENLLEDTTFIVDIDDKNTRIDKYLSDELADVSRSRIQKLLDEGMITVNIRLRLMIL